MGEGGWDRRQVLGAGVAGLLMAGRGAAADAPIVCDFALEDRRVWLAATIGSSKAYTFVLDTGAPRNFMRPQIATELNLTISGGAVTGGLGARRDTGSVVTARNVVIGGAVRQAQMVFTTYDFGRGLHPDAAGLFAAGLLTARDADLDFDKGEWRTYVGGRPDHAGFVELPSRFVEVARGRLSSKIEVTAFIDGRPYRLVADTGSPGGVLLFSSAARREKLFDDSRPYAIEQTSGFGGAAAKLSRVMRRDRLQFGEFTVHKPLVRVMDPDQEQAGLQADGVIGIELLQMFNLSTEVRHGRVWAIRNNRPAPREWYRIAGLWFDRAADGSASVAEVGTGSPAAAAGIRRGDVVAAPARFEQAIAMLNQPAGSEVILGIKRGEAVEQKRFTLRPYL
jgi:hypothetical protein